MRLKKISNTCYAVELADSINIFSYESHVATVMNMDGKKTLLVKEYYVKYSKTTSKHINQAASYYEVSERVIV